MSRTAGTLGIMVHSHHQRKLVLKKYSVHRSARWKLFCFTPSDIDWERRKIQGLHLNSGKWMTRSFPFPGAIYNRCYNSDVAIISRIEACIGRNKCFNHINQLDKLEVHNHLSRWLCSYLPDALPYDRAALEHMLTLHKLVYLKPCHGHMGKGVYRILQRDSGGIHISSHHVLPSIIIDNFSQLHEETERLMGTTPFLIQRGIHTTQLNNRTFDIRVLVQKNKTGQWSVTNIISRIAFEGCFNTSICEKVYLTRHALKQLYPEQTLQDMIHVIQNISLRSAEIIELDAGIHLCELSVDVALDTEGHIWIIEVNGMPQKSLYDDVKIQKKGVYTRPIEYGMYLSSR